MSIRVIDSTHYHILGVNAYGVDYFECLEVQLQDALLETYLPSQPGTLLDVGCGPGTWSEKFMGMGWAVTAVDICPAMLSKAIAKHIGRTSFHAQIGDVCSLEFDDETFDVAYAQGDVVSYSTAPIKALRELHRVVRQHGIGFISVDNSLFIDQNGIARLEGNWDDGLYRYPCDYLGIGWTFPTVGLPPAEWHQIIASIGWHVLDIVGKGAPGEFPLAPQAIATLDCRSDEWLAASAHVEFIVRKE